MEGVFTCLALSDGQDSGRLLYSLIWSLLMPPYDLQQDVALHVSLHVLHMHRDPHQLLECLQTSVPVALRWRRTDFIIALSAFFFCTLNTIVIPN